MKNYEAHQNHAKPSHFLNSHEVFCLQFCVTHMGKMRLHLNLLLRVPDKFTYLNTWCSDVATVLGDSGIHRMLSISGKYKSLENRPQGL